MGEIRTKAGTGGALGVGKLESFNIRKAKRQNEEVDTLKYTEKRLAWGIGGVGQWEDWTKVIPCLVSPRPENRPQTTERCLSPKREKGVPF